MTLNDSVKIGSTLFVQQVDNEIVILDTKSEEYFGLDAMGAVMWEELSQSGSLQKVFDVVSETYEVDDSQLEADIIRFVVSLADAGLVQVESR